MVLKGVIEIGYIVYVENSDKGERVFLVWGVIVWYVDRKERCIFC